MGSFSKTFRLMTSMPSFSKGLARSVDVGNTIDIYNLSRSDEQADLEALKSDWEAVGKDIDVSIQKYAQQVSRSGL